VYSGQFAAISLTPARIRVIEGTIELVLISLPHVLIPRQISK
jgi:hypothetical protein